MLLCSIMLLVCLTYMCALHAVASQPECDETVDGSCGGSAVDNLEEMQTVTVQVGMDVELDCIVNGDSLVTWQRVGGVLPASSEVIGSLLRIYGVRVQDEGVYRCQASNQAGSVSQQTQLEITSAPVLHTESHTRVAPLGSRVEMTCEAEGSPAPVIEWSKHQGQLPRGYKLITGSLIINNLQSDAYGVYVCTAVNRYGVTTANVTLVSGITKTDSPNIDGTNWSIIISITFGVLLAASTFVLLVFLYIRYQHREKRQIQTRDTGAPQTIGPGAAPMNYITAYGSHDQEGHETQYAEYAEINDDGVCGHYYNLPHMSKHGNHTTDYYETPQDQPANNYYNLPNSNSATNRAPTYIEVL